ncbi:MAG: hypothetical protein ACF8SC_06930 [Phycisphaerales bacterium JB037]
MRRLTTIFSGLSAAALLATPALAQPQTQPQTGTPAQPAADLPEADAIFDRFIEAIGGEEAIRAQKNRAADGTMTSEDGSYFAFLNVWAAEPALLKTRVEEPGKPSVEQYFDGRFGWVISATGEGILLRGASLRDIAESATFFAYLEYEKSFPQRRTAAETTWDGKPAYRVDVVSVFGKRPRLYFAKETGLLLGIETVSAGPQGDMPSSAILRNYKEVDGVKVATEVVQNAGGNKITIRYNNYRANIDDFPEIKLPDRLQEIVDELERRQREQQEKQGGEPGAGGGGG